MIKFKVFLDDVNIDCTDKDFEIAMSYGMSQYDVAVDMFMDTIYMSGELAIKVDLGLAPKANTEDIVHLMINHLDKAAHTEAIQMNLNAGNVCVSSYRPSLEGNIFNKSLYRISLESIERRRDSGFALMATETYVHINSTFVLMNKRKVFKP